MNRTHPPSLKIATDVKSENVSDLTLEQALAEPVPDEHTETADCIQFVTKMHAVEVRLTKGTGLLQYRIGHALLLLRRGANGQHGRWTPFVEETFPFTVRSANTYIRLALSPVTEEDAMQHGVMELYERAGLVEDKPHRGKKSEAPTQQKTPTVSQDNVLHVLDRICRDMRAVTQMPIVRKKMKPAKDLYSHIETRAQEIKGHCQDIIDDCQQTLRRLDQQTPSDLTTRK